MYNEILTNFVFISDTYKLFNVFNFFLLILKIYSVVDYLNKIVPLLDPRIERYTSNDSRPTRKSQIIPILFFVTILHMRTIENYVSNININ